MGNEKIKSNLEGLRRKIIAGFFLKKEAEQQTQLIKAIDACIKEIEKDETKHIVDMLTKGIDDALTKYKFQKRRKPKQPKYYSQRVKPLPF